MDYKEIPGLSYTANAIDSATSDKLLKFINSKPWQKSLKRQVQQYGVFYDYSTKSLGATTEIPDILLDLAKTLNLPTPENIIINKYEPGEGIGQHTDSLLFGDVIASLSLCSAIPMDLISGSNYHSIWLEPNSLLKLTGMSRFHWTHGIVGRKSDIYNGKKVLRKTRISITFRALKSTKVDKSNKVDKVAKSNKVDKPTNDDSDWVEL